LRRNFSGRLPFDLPLTKFQIELRKHRVILISILPLLFAVLFFTGPAGGQTISEMTVEGLRCEYLRKPLGIDTPKPRLSWILKSQKRRQTQTGYQILVAGSKAKLGADKGDLWNSGMVESPDLNGVTYSGSKLQPLQRCFWKVRCRDKQGRLSHWSQASQWTMGLLEKKDWCRSKWISSVDDPMFLLRKQIELPDKPKRALACVAAMGYYRLYVNGRKVDDHILSPAVSDYSERAFYITHDITEYLHKGKNCLGFSLGRGWYRGDLPGVIHPAPLVKSRFYLEFGEKERNVVTDRSWKFHRAPSRPIGQWKARDFGGIKYNANLESQGWTRVGFDDTSWKPAVAVNVSDVAVCAQMVQPNRVMKQISAKSVRPLGAKSYLVDMGQNFTGWLSLNIGDNQPAGSEIKIEYADMLLEDDRLRSYGRRDSYICRGDDDERFRCGFNYHGFRWVKIDNLNEQPELEDIKGEMISTDLPGTADFECSNALLNEIYDTCMWTYRCLSLGGYVVDCPHRERLGYGGDGQASMETGLTNFDSAAFYGKWLGDWRNAQDDQTGDLPYTAPSPYSAGGGPAWSGICVTLPWEIYIRYGDERVLNENYEMIRKWLGFLQSKVKDGLLRKYAAKGQNEIWSFLGDWVPPGRGQAPDERISPESTLFFNNCYYLYNLQTAERIARVLGHKKDSSVYAQKAERLKEKIDERFYNQANGKYAQGLQTDIVMAMLTGLGGQKMQEHLTEQLEKSILVENKGHLDTGIHGTYYLLKVLDDRGLNDLAYEVVNKRTYPGWGYMLSKGATTIWEQWDGQNSRIHNCFLSVGNWFIEGPGGIKPDPERPGYSHFYIKPAVIRDLRGVKAHYDSIRGRIVSEWHIEEDIFKLKVKIPVNSQATIYLPCRAQCKITESGRPISELDYIKPGGLREGQFTLEVPSGNFEFSCGLATTEMPGNPKQPETKTGN